MNMLARQTVRLSMVRCWGGSRFFTSALSSHSRSSSTSYMVSVTYPFKGDKAEGQQIAEGRGYDGSFRFVARDIFLWHFNTSIPANKARRADFLLDSNASVSSDILLPGSPKVYIPEISLDSILVADYKTKVDIARKQCLKFFYEDQKLVPFDKKEEELNAIFSCMEVDPDQFVEPYEITSNVLLARQINRVAEPWGYKVLANSSKPFEDEHPVNSSRFFRSKPDLIFFNLDSNHVMTTMEELEDEDEVEVLHAATGECNMSFTTEEDILPQLLGNFEKVAGDVVQERLIRGKRKHFDEIILYGLLINYKQKSCRIYKLHLDFVNRTSFLEQGQERLPLSDAVNNLLFNFDPKNVHIHK